VRRGWWSPPATSSSSSTIIGRRRRRQRVGDSLRRGGDNLMGRARRQSFGIEALLSVIWVTLRAVGDGPGFLTPAAWGVPGLEAARCRPARPRRGWRDVPQIDPLVSDAAQAPESRTAAVPTPQEGHYARFATRRPSGASRRRAPGASGRASIAGSGPTGTARVRELLVAALAKLERASNLLLVRNHSVSTTFRHEAETDSRAQGNDARGTR
jgi:hypothetical protein